MRLDFGKFAIVAVSACSLIGASAAVAAALSLSKPVEEPLPPAPTTLQAVVKADGVLVEGPELARGSELTSVEEAGELTGAYAGLYYRAVYDGKTVYLAKAKVRTSAEPAYEQWTGFATADAIIFARPDFTGDDLLTLSANEEVTVLDAIGDILFVRNADGYEGYISSSKVATSPAEEEAPSATGNASSAFSSSKRPSSSNGSSSSGSSSSGSSNAAPSSPPSAGGNSGNSGNSGSSSGGGSSVDGDEMTLPVSFALHKDPFLFGVGVAYADEPESSGVTGVVLIDGAQSYVAMLNRGDAVTVKVDEDFGFEGRKLTDGSEAERAVALRDAKGEAQLEGSDGEPIPAEPKDAASDKVMRQSPEDAALAGGDASHEDMCTIEVNGQEAYLPESLIRLDDELAFEERSVYALEGATLYADYGLKAASRELEPNTELRVVDAIDSVLVVELDSALFYLPESSTCAEPAQLPEDEEAGEGDAAAQPGSSSASKPSANRGGSGGLSGNSGSSGSSGGSSSGSASGSASSGTTDSSSNGGSSGSGASGSDSSSSDEDAWTAPKL